MQISIVDIGINNSRSIERAFNDRLMANDVLSIYEKHDTNFQKSDLIVIPGVGNFGVAINNLMDSGLFDQIISACQKGKKILGICLGMQILFESSDESPNTKGLGIIPGSCHKISSSVSNRIPHVGWNEVVTNSANLHFKALNENKDFYFVHSYHVEPSNELSILTSTNLERGQIISSVLHHNVLGFQFHPEKSGVIGGKLLEEVISWARNET